MRKIDASQHSWHAITDVRFDNEAEAIHRRGGVVWRIVRPGAGLGGAEGEHSSEQGIDPSLVDDEVVNDGDLSRLRAAVEDAWARLHGDIMR